MAKKETVTPAKSAASKKPVNKDNERPDVDILKENVSHNLNVLIKRKNMTQRDLADKTEYCAAAVCRYFRGNQYPPIDFLLKLKKLYGISIDEFVSSKMSDEADNDLSVGSSPKFSDPSDLEISRKYCGNYIVYYLDTSNYKGRENTDASEAIVYGVINIHESKIDFKYEYRCFAFLGIQSREEAERVKKDLDSLENATKINEYLSEYKSNHILSTIYTGDFTFGAKHAYLSLKHGNIDRALIILYRIESNKENYRGGLGVVNSGSKGREKMPTAQFIALSRYPVSLSEEELHNELLLTYPRLKADDKNVTELISVFKKTYLDEDGVSSMFTEEQKELMFKAFLENTIKKIVTNNMNRCAKASEKDDASWYKLIKREMNNQKLENSGKQ